eukprot:m51a1_g5798 hypothetical protein (1595) ;mRNA; r:66269-71758
MAVLAVVFVATNIVVLVSWYNMSTRSPTSAAVGATLPSIRVSSTHVKSDRKPLRGAKEAAIAAAVAPHRRVCEPLTREETSEGPWVDLVVPLRNRAARLVDVAYNVAELRRSGGDRRLRVVVVDVGSTDANITGLAEGLSRRTCDTSAGFSRAHALRAGLSEVYRRWPDDIVFCLDVDMQLPAETFMSDARKHIVRGTSYWAPIAFGTYENRPVVKAPGNGRWRTMFKGDLGFFASDAVKIGLFSTEQTAIKWGNEDDKAFAALGRSGLAVRRYEMEGFFHVWHPTAPWKSSPDGMTPHDADTEPQETAQAAVPLPQQIHRTTGETGPGQECGDGEEGGEGQPWVSFVVPLFNRSRDLEGLLLDVDALWRTGGDRRMGVVVADQSSTDTDVAALVAKVSRGICVPVTVVRATAPRGRTFSRAGALRAGLESVAASHPDGIMFCLNVDMRLPRAFMRRLRRNVVRGVSAWAPVAFGLLEGKPPEVERDSGAWRRDSVGDIGLFVDDALKLDLFASEQKRRLGTEEEKTFYALARSPLAVHRKKMRGLFHVWHPPSTWRDERSPAGPGEGEEEEEAAVDTSGWPALETELIEEQGAGCRVGAEEGAGAWLDLVVPLRNRAGRLAELGRNVGEMRREGGDRRLRLVVVDQNSSDADVGGLLRGLARETCVPALLVRWPTRAALGFSRAATLRAGIREVYRRWPGDLVFTLDADMLLPAATFAREARQHTVRGAAFWSPVSFATRQGRPPVADPANGDWKRWGKGDLGVYAADAVRLDLFAADERKYTWGGEDDRAFDALVAAGFQPRRYNMSGYFHLWHPKAQWQSSRDGITRDLPSSCAVDPALLAGAPWLSFLVPFRDRPDRLAALLYNVGDVWRLVDRRLRVVVADQNPDDAANASAIAASAARDTCVDVRLLRVPADHHRGGAAAARVAALRAALLDVGDRHPDDMVFVLDVEMILPTLDFMRQARQHIVRGVSFWAPIPFSTYRWKLPEVDPANGRWDIYSRSSIGIFASDALSINLFAPVWTDTTWATLSMSNLTMHRNNLTGFIHQWHPKPKPLSSYKVQKAPQEQTAGPSPTAQAATTTAEPPKVVKHTIVIYEPHPNDCSNVTPGELEGPWLNIIVPLRNRADRLAVLLWSVGDMWRVGGDKRIRVVVADQGSTDADLSVVVDRVSSESCVDVRVIQVPAPEPAVGFSRVAALRAGLSEVLNAHPDDAVFFLDVDMRLPEQEFMREARRHIVQGVSAWAPVAFETRSGRPVVVAPANGKWRSYDAGNIGVFASDAVAANILADCELEGFFHLWHPHAAWADSADGLIPGVTQYNKPEPLDPSAMTRALPARCWPGDAPQGEEEEEAADDDGDGEPWIDFVVALRNRSPRLAHLARNIARLRSADPHVRLVVADNNSTDADVPALVAALATETCLPMWHLGVPRLRPGFAKAAALRAALLDVHAKFPGDIAFTVDVDMLLPDDFAVQVRRNVIRGREFWAPICFGLSEGRPAAVAPDNGVWRVLGTGNMGFFVSDAITVRLYAEHVRKTTHGWEDIRAYNLLSKDGLRMRANRNNVTGLFHLWHPKAPWEGSRDGMRAVDEAPRAPAQE